MTCPSCQAENDDAAEVCFRCGKGLFALIQGSVLGGRYEIVSPLGKGGMGMVYKAFDREFEEHVAIKVLRAELSSSSDTAKRFRSEGKLARKVSHRNVCRIHEYGRDGHRSYIVMELVEGMDFKRILREGGPLPPREAYDVAIQVAGALEAIHDAGIVHRDLKTPNIMRDAHGVVKLMDFGIAKNYDSGTTGATATGHVVGTPEYMSPEQARGEKLDARSDIYALGIVAFELFTGEVPFHGDTPIVTLFKHIQTPPPLHGPEGARLPRPVVPLLEKALAKSRDERFATAGAMAEALKQARGVSFGQVMPTPTPTPIRVAAVPEVPMTEPITTPVPTPTPMPSPAVVPRQADRVEPTVPEMEPPVSVPPVARTLVQPPPPPARPPVPTPTPMPSLEVAPRQADTVAETVPGMDTPVSVSPVAPTPAQPPPRRPAPIPATPVARTPPPAEPRRPEGSPPPKPVAPPLRPAGTSKLGAWVGGATVGGVVLVAGLSLLVWIKSRAPQVETATGVEPSPAAVGEPTPAAPPTTIPEPATPRPTTEPAPASPPATLAATLTPKPSATPRAQPSPVVAAAPSPTPRTAVSPPSATQVTPPPTPAPSPSIAAQPERLEAAEVRVAPPPSAPRAEPAATLPAATLAPGNLAVTAKPWADVSIDGKAVGKTPLRSVTLPPGEHVVTLSHPDYEPLRRVVQLQPGAKLALAVDLRDEALKRKK